MKLSYFQLETHLAKQLASIYLISGDELLVKQDAANMVRKAATKAGFTEKVRTTLDGNTHGDELHALLYANSLFESQRLIELDCRDSTPPKEIAALLKEYAQKPSPSNVLLIQTSKIDDKVARSAWHTAIEKAGIVATIWPISRDQLPQWVINRAKKYKLTIQPNAAELLAEYVEGNLVAAAQVIEKAYLLKPEHAIDMELLNFILTDESRFTVFDLVDAAITGNHARALHILDVLKLDGTDPVLALWGLTRELRMLYEFSNSLKQGATYEALFQKHRVFQRRQPLLRRFLSKQSPADCGRYLLSAAHIDKMLKGASKGNPWEALQLFCLRFA